MAVNQPDITGDTSGGITGGVPGGTTTVPGGLPSVAGSPAAAAQPGSPSRTLQTRWRPDPFTNFHQRLDRDPAGASRDLDTAIQRTYSGLANLESQIACTQVGSASITGSKKAIPTGLASVSNCSGSIDNGTTAHNFWLSVTPSQTPGAIDVAVWMPTAAGDNTPIAATTAVTVRWLARGSL